MAEPLVEVVVSRADPRPDQVTVFVNGEKVTDASVVLIDPGQGFTDRAEWEQYRISVTLPNLTPACRAVVVDALDRHSDSEFIDDEKQEGVRR